LSHLGNILECYCTVSTTAAVKNACLKLVEKLLTETFIFKYHSEEVAIWIESLQTCKSEKAILWLDNLLTGLINEPVKSIQFLGKSYSSCSISAEMRPVADHLMKTRLWSLDPEISRPSFESFNYSDTDELSLSPYSPAMLFGIQRLLKCSDEADIAPFISMVASRVVYETQSCREYLSDILKSSLKSMDEDSMDVDDQDTIKKIARSSEWKTREFLSCVILSVSGTSMASLPKEKKRKNQADGSLTIHDVNRDLLTMIKSSDSVDILKTFMLCRHPALGSIFLIYDIIKESWTNTSLDSDMLVFLSSLPASFLLENWLVGIKSTPSLGQSKPIQQLLIDSITLENSYAFGSHILQVMSADKGLADEPFILDLLKIVMQVLVIGSPSNYVKFKECIFQHPTLKELCDSDIRYGICLVT
jgi:hypothetical protein